MIEIEEETKTLLMLKGVIADMPHDQAAKVNQCVEAIHALISDNGSEGVLAVALVGAELQLEAAKQGF